MRVVPVLLLAAALLALPASATRLDPKALVLQQNDVPVRYVFDANESVRLPNAFFAVTPELRAIVARTGQVTGYLAEYLNSDPPRWRYIQSMVGVFHRPDGARLYLAWFDRSVRRREPKYLERRAVSIGSAGWRYSAPSEPATVVIWRQGRVFAMVTCSEMAGHQKFALALARKHEQRIAAALR